jgi:hypothetical protein
MNDYEIVYYSITPSLDHIARRLGVAQAKLILYTAAFRDFLNQLIHLFPLDYLHLAILVKNILNFDSRRTEGNFDDSAWSVTLSMLEVAFEK